MRKNSKKFGFLDFISLIAIILLILSNVNTDNVPIPDDVIESTTEYVDYDNNTEDLTESTTEDLEEADGLYSPRPDDYYLQLDRAGKEIYSEIYKAAGEGKTSCKFKNIDVDAYCNSVKSAVYAFVFDHPEYFWFNNGHKYTYGLGNFEVELGVDDYWQYSMNKNKYTDSLQKKVDEIVARANKFDTDYDKIKFVHDYLVNTVEYDYKALEEINSGGTKTTSSKQSATPYGCLVNGKAICSGYSEGFQLIMDELGIECNSVWGDAGGPHQWNVVKLDGDYYFIDCTWDDPKGVNEVQYDYFLINLKEISKTHTPDNTFVYPQCTATKY